MRGNYVQEWTRINRVTKITHKSFTFYKVGEDAMLFYFELVVILLCTKLAGDIKH